jgi:hypothetical protein
MELGIIAKKFKVKNVALPGHTSNKEAGDESEHSDYCEEDFKDLMSRK